MTNLSRLRLVLALSLALNLFGAGYLAARHWGGGGLRLADTMLGVEDSDRPLRRLFAELPPADAQALREAFVASRPALRTQFLALRQATEEVRAELARDPVDPERLRSALMAAQSRRGRLAETVGMLVLEAAPRLSLAGRQVLAGFRLMR